MGRALCACLSEAHGQTKTGKPTPQLSSARPPVTYSLQTARLLTPPQRKTALDTIPANPHP
ncbi:hypothetical protein JANAI62_06960 [Jannaschia pagri]|uniref:Uncharacterized protein n=1 Tax=Jannaschia pagri TaxID=2829797 RepID=A0ABQ4NI16_9RHOB|nr:hypothetical protein JANAI61_02780 [Jannaschia sp. AI_61]GIT94073.1 hypothetical protein JANAI62_06960 [Jannaschia sp. AI_62]